LKTVVFIEVNVTIFHNFSLKYIFDHKGQKNAHLVNIHFFGVSTYFYIENERQNILFFNLENVSKALYFLEINIYNFIIFSPISNPFKSYDSTFDFTCY